MDEEMRNRKDEHAVGKDIGEIPMPLHDGKLEREAIISADDILNLLIALNTSTSLDEFLEQI